MCQSSHTWGMATETAPHFGLHLIWHLVWEAQYLPHFCPGHPSAGLSSAMLIELEDLEVLQI